MNKFVVKISLMVVEDMTSGRNSNTLFKFGLPSVQHNYKFTVLHFYMDILKKLPEKLFLREAFPNGP